MNEPKQDDQTGLEHGERLEHLEQMIGLELDGRLSASQADELARMRAGSEQVRELTASMRSLRAEMLADPAPAVPDGLRGRILDRVAEARARVGVEAAVLPLVRRLTLAAAVLLVAGLFALNGGVSGFINNSVGASPSGALEEPTVEDDLQAHPAEQGSFLEYLRWRFLRRAP